MFVCRIILAEGKAIKRTKHSLYWEQIQNRAALGISPINREGSGGKHQSQANLTKSNILDTDSIVLIFIKFNISERYKCVSGTLNITFEYLFCTLEKTRATDQTINGPFYILKPTNLLNLQQEARQTHWTASFSIPVGRAENMSSVHRNGFLW